MTCEVSACSRPLNRDGLCLPHKLGSVRFNGGHRLRMERDGNYTQSSIAREVMADAKADGKDIALVRGRRTATETYSKGSWRKT